MNTESAVKIALVGHTNTGKTSLMRTLTRDSEFGEVSSRPSTTRHVEGARLVAEGEVLVELFDTPGMEDPIALFDLLETLGEENPDDRMDGPARIQAFLTHPAAAGRLEQEAKVLRQVLASDAAMYVIDARDPVLAKHKDELAVLGWCALPVLPVLNFVSTGQSNESAWREALARLGLHVVVRFDTIAPERGAERVLFDKLANLLDFWRPALDKLVVCREREAAARLHAGQRLIAELLVDVAACRWRAPSDPLRREKVLSLLNQSVREREQVCVEALLRLFQFRHEAVNEQALPLVNGRWEQDLFNPETVRDAGVKVGTGAAAGAAVGLGVDAMFAGLTLGTATAIGAIAGGGLQAVRHFGQQLGGALTGEYPLTVDDAILRLLMLRQLHLLQALDLRGHAALKPIAQFAEESTQWREGPLHPSLIKARAHPQWSSLTGMPEVSGDHPDENAAATGQSGTSTQNASLQASFGKQASGLFRSWAGNTKQLFATINPGAGQDMAREQAVDTLANSIALKPKNQAGVSARAKEISSD